MKKYNDLFFYIAYAVLMIRIMLSNIPIIEKYGSVFIIIFALIMSGLFIINFKKEKKKQYLKIIIFVMITLLSFYFSKGGYSSDTSLLIMSLLIIPDISTDFNKIIKFDIILKTVLTIIVFILCAFGLANDYAVIRGMFTRHSFGFIHPNVLGIIISTLVIEFTYLKKECLEKKYYVIYILAVLFIFIFTGSRSSMILLILNFSIILLKNTKVYNFVNNKYFKFIVKNSFIILTVVSLIMILLYYFNTKTGQILDSVFSHRLYYSTIYLKNYHVNFFGNSLIYPESEVVLEQVSNRLLLDNCFIYYLLRFGIFAYAMLGYLFKKTFDKLYENKDTLLIWIFLFFIFYGMMEKYLCVIFYNVFLMYFQNVLYSKNIGKEEEDKCIKLQSQVQDM